MDKNLLSRAMEHPTIKLKHKKYTPEDYQIAAALISGMISPIQYCHAYNLKKRSNYAYNKAFQCIRTFIVNKKAAIVAMPGTLPEEK